MIYEIFHSTVYRYFDPVTISQNLAHLRPRPSPRHTWKRSELTIDPTPTNISDRVDVFGNSITFFALQEAHSGLAVTSTGRVEVQPTMAIAPASTQSWEQVSQNLTCMTEAECLATQFVFESAFVKSAPELTQYAAQSFPPGRPVLEAAMDLMHRIFTDFKFDARATTITTPVQDVFAMRRGVCQDFAHLMIGCLRALGLPARYVSGYILTRPATGSDKPRLIGGDASHAWVSVFCGDAGWIDLDPTNDKLVSDQHITIAWGRDFGDVSPIQGIILGGKRHSLAISVDVCPLAADAA